MFKPTLAVNADFSKIKYPVFASPKLDGIRCSIVNGQALSRTLKPIPNKFITLCLSQSNLTGLDGELIVGSPTSKTCYTDSVSNVMRHEGEPDFTYYVFDIHNIQSKYAARYAELQRRLSATVWIKTLEQKLIHTEADMLEYEAAKVAEGYEGIILRSPDAPYKFGRSTVNEGFMLKVKRFTDQEFQVVGFEERMHNGNEATVNELGRTKRSSHQENKSGRGDLGALVLKHGDITFNCGTGFDDALRTEIWENKSKYIGKLAKVKHFEVGAKNAPRHPVFLGFRDARDM